MISGASLPAYWVSHYVADVIFEAPPSIAAIAAYIGFNLDVSIIFYFIFFRFLMVGSFS
jgi:hypothetical protein